MVVGLLWSHSRVKIQPEFRYTRHRPQTQPDPRTPHLLVPALHKKSWAVIDRPYSLGCATVGALYERPRCIFCAKPMYCQSGSNLNTFFPVQGLVKALGSFLYNWCSKRLLSETGSRRGGSVCIFLYWSYSHRHCSLKVAAQSPARLPMFTEACPAKLRFRPPTLPPKPYTKRKALPPARTRWPSYRLEHTTCRRPCPGWCRSSKKTSRSARRKPCASILRSGTSA